MVHDPRVSPILARLGGIYRDPSRVDRDVSTLLKSSVGEHLTPILGHLVESNPPINCNCLLLQGTIGMYFKGNTYQLLIDLYCPPGYPYRPPIAYVRLANPTMYYKENHKHVGLDGKVYLPYLHEWKANTHNFIELIVAMSSTFSADPPVFTRRQTAATTTTPPPPPPSGTSSHTSPAAATGGGDDYQQMIAQEVDEANRIAEIARLAELKEQQEKEAAKRQEEKAQRLAKAQQDWENEQRDAVKKQLTHKLQKHLADQIQQTSTKVRDDVRDQQRLQIAQEQKISKQLTLYSTTKEQYQTQLETVQEKTTEIKEWLAEYEQNHKENMQTASNHSSNDNADPTFDQVDKMVQPKSKIHNQMLQLAAENSSLTDVLYFMDQALIHGHLELSTYMKQVRKIAKRQFLVRAHLLKINQKLKEQSISGRSC